MFRPLAFVPPALLLASAALAADWPQWRGPDRTGLSKETGLVESLPAKGPKLLWTFDKAGLGYAGPAIVGDTLYSLGAEDGTNKEFVFAVDTRTGKQRWSADIGDFYDNNWGGGPRSTPTVNDNRVYALGANGSLVCLDAQGKRVWGVSLVRDLGGSVPGWGYCESPLVDGDKLICTPGGDKGTMAALDKKTGKVLWRSTGLTDDAAYSSAVVTEAGGVRQYVQMTPEGVVGVAAKDGKLLWRSELGRNSTAVIPTPIVHGDHVFVTSGYGSGCGLLKLSGDGPGGVKAEQVYANKDMTNQHGGVVLLDGKLYGHSDRGGWACMDFLAGKVLWKSNKLDKGSLTYADGRLYCYGQDKGTCAQVKASPAGWEETGRFELPKESDRRKPSGAVWTHPVVANGKLYLRDQELLFCFDVTKGQ